MSAASPGPPTPTLRTSCTGRRGSRSRPALACPSACPTASPCATTRGRSRTAPRRSWPRTGTLWWRSTRRSCRRRATTLCVPSSRPTPTRGAGRATAPGPARARPPTSSSRSAPSSKSSWASSWPPCTRWSRTTCAASSPTRATARPTLRRGGSYTSCGAGGCWRLCAFRAPASPPRREGEGGGGGEEGGVAGAAGARVDGSCGRPSPCPQTPALPSAPSFS